MSLKTGFRFKIKYVKPFAKGIRFQIGDKIAESDPPEYINYQVTVFDAPNLSDGDTITLTEINSLEVKKYNNKLYYSFIGKIKTEAQEVPQEQYKDNSAESLLPFDI